MISLPPSKKRIVPFLNTMFCRTRSCPFFFFKHAGSQNKWLLCKLTRLQNILFWGLFLHLWETCCCLHFCLMGTRRGHKFAVKKWKIRFQGGFSCAPHRGFISPWIPAWFSCLSFQKLHPCMCVCVDALRTCLCLSRTLSCVCAWVFLFQSLLDEPNPNSPANNVAAKMYQENRREYEKKVKVVVEDSWVYFGEVSSDWGQWWSWVQFSWSLYRIRAPSTAVITPSFCRRNVISLWQS